MENTNAIALPNTSKRLKSSAVDRLSKLPDTILIHILSLLPTTDAVKTILVPRFRHLWTSVHSLSFNECLYHDCCNLVNAARVQSYDERFINFVRHVLILHESLIIDKFHLRLRLSFPESKEKRMGNEIDTWVRFAMRKKVKVLDMDLSGCGCSYTSARYKLPYIVFTGDNLIELKLTGCDIKPRGKIQLRSLKKLSLKEIWLGDKILDAILFGCPLLESLFLIKCFHLHELNFDYPNIKNLLIILSTRECSYPKISCPNLMSLEIVGPLNNISSMNVPSLVTASCYFSDGFYCIREYDDVRMLFEKLSHVKTFEPCTHCILMMMIWEFKKKPCPTFSFKSLVLHIPLIKWHLPGISSLLRNSPFLETLTMYIYPGQYSTVTGPRHIGAPDFDGENYWRSNKASFKCLRNQLKTVKIYGYVTEPYVIELVEFVLMKAKVLEKLVISTKRTLNPSQQHCISSTEVGPQKGYFTSEKLLEFSRKLLSFPRASTGAVIDFSY